MCIYTSMRIQCYRSHMSNLEQDPLSLFVQRVGGWMSVGIGCVDYWVPEPYALMIYMYDPTVERRSGDDYLV